MLTQFDVTAHEYADGFLSEQRRAAAAQSLLVEGVIVLRNAIDPDHVRTLRLKMEADIPELLNRVTDNGAKGQVHHSPPPFAPYVFADVVANPICTSICEAAISSPVHLTFMGGNTNLPGSEAQRVHRDHGNLWPDMEHAHPPAILAAYIPLVDMDETNGATEVWPRTHHTARGTGSEFVPDHVRPEVYIDHDKPPTQAVCPAGAILLRDARGWHRAMPNRSARPRVMLSFVYAARWRRANKPVDFMRSAEDALSQVDIPLNARYLDEPIDYLEDWTARNRRRAAREAVQPWAKGQYTSTAG